MTKPKHVASTLTNILSNPVLQSVMDKNSDCRDWISVIDEYWRPDLEKRKPAPAEFDDEGNIIKAGSYDMASFLYGLYDRECLIEIPEYESSTPTTINEGQHKVSPDRRRGRIIGVTSNQETFNFSVRIVDENIVSADTYGYPRNYKITDEKGYWYEGWSHLNFVPTAEENKFLTEHKLWDGNSIPFSTFVTPEKWISLYGQYYFITKVAVTRLSEELKFLKKQDDLLWESGIRPPRMDTGKDNTPWDSKSSREDKGEQYFVRCIEFEVDVPEYDLDFENYPITVDALMTIREKKKAVRKALSKFRFMTRCIEFAAWQKLKNHWYTLQRDSSSMSDYEYIYKTDSDIKKLWGIMPAWIKNVAWEPYKTSTRSRIVWHRLKLVQPAVGELSVSIRFRVTRKKFWKRNKDSERKTTKPDYGVKASTS